jgi:competence ComEA-like helix-hairpin-helix protein
MQLSQVLRTDPTDHVPVCKTPIALVENAREQLACAEAFPNCTNVLPGDRVQIEKALCKITPQGMSASMRLVAGLKINLNTATAEELALLDGIGIKMGQAIIDYRQAHGPFDTTRDLGEVHGVGLATLQKLLPYVTAE